MLAPGATPPSPPSGARPSVVALPRLGGLGSCWGSIRLGSESRPGQVRHGRLVVGGLRGQWLTASVVVGSCSVGARGMQHETGRGRWTPGTGASSPSSMDRARSPGLLRLGRSQLELASRWTLWQCGTVCQLELQRGALSGRPPNGLGPGLCERVSESAGSPSTSHCLRYPARAPGLGGLGCAMLV